MLKKLSEKLTAKFPATTPGYSMVKNCPSRWRFLRSFLTASKPSGRSITATKRKEKETKERRKKKSKIEKRKDLGHFLVQKIARLAKMSQNAMQVARRGPRRASRRVANAFSARLRLIGPLHDPVTWYKITHTGEQVAQWDFQNNAPAFVLEVPQRHQYL